MYYKSPRRRDIYISFFSGASYTLLFGSTRHRKCHRSHLMAERRTPQSVQCGSGQCLPFFPGSRLLEESLKLPLPNTGAQKKEKQRVSALPGSPVLQPLMLSGTPGVGSESSEAKLAQTDMLVWALFNWLKRIKSFLALYLITKQVHAFILKRKFKQYPRVYNKAWKLSFSSSQPLTCRFLIEFGVPGLVGENAGLEWEWVGPDQSFATG